MLNELLRLEERGWAALSSRGEAGAQFYETILHEDAVMLFPGGLRLTGKAAILKSLAAEPWQTFVLAEPALLDLGGGAAFLSYQVVAQREGSPAYRALVGSTYVNHQGRWLLAAHQHTPL